MTKKKGIIRKIHIQAIIFLVVYNIISKTVFVKAIISPNLLIAYIVPYIFGVMAGAMFLYLFSHEDFFHFIKDIEQKEKGKESKYLKKYLHYGKVACALIVALFGGMTLEALTIRFLLNKYKYKYWLIAIGNIGSTILMVSIARGAISLVF